MSKVSVRTAIFLESNSRGVVYNGSIVKKKAMEAGIRIFHDVINVKHIYGFELSVKGIIHFI